MVNKDDIVDKVRNRISGIPSDLNDSMIESMIEDAHIDIENYTGGSFAISNIPTKYQSVITSLSCLYVLSYMTGSELDSNLSLGGGVSIDYGQASDSLTRQMNFFTNRVNANLKTIGKSLNYGISDPRSG